MKTLAIRTLFPKWGALKPQRVATLRLPGVRLLPLTIFGAVLMLGVRAGDVWLVATGKGELPGVQTSLAQGAKEAGKPAEAKPAEHAPAAAPAAHGPEAAAPAGEHGAPASHAPAAGGEGAAQTFTPSQVEVLQRLAERRDALDARERTIEQREAMLQVTEQRLEQKIGELQTIKKELQTLLGQAKADQQAQLESLVKIYETMKPKEAANIFEAMDNKGLIDIIARMKEAKTAPILAAMDPKRAQEVTLLLANRKNLPTVPE